jgi:hypothetical protein
MGGMLFEASLGRKVSETSSSIDKPYLMVYTYNPNCRGVVDRRIIVWIKNMRPYPKNKAKRVGGMAQVVAFLRL